MDKKQVYKKITMLATVLLFVLVLVLLIQIVMISVEYGKQQKLNDEINSLQKEISSLEDSIDYKQSILYIEKYAREQLGLYSEDDIIFVPKS